MSKARGRLTMFAFIVCIIGMAVSVGSLRAEPLTMWLSPSGEVNACVCQLVTVYAGAEDPDQCSPIIMYDRMTFDASDGWTPGEYGCGERGCGQSFSRTFNSKGDYTLTVTATDTGKQCEKGETDTRSVTFHVHDKWDPAPTISVEPIQIENGVTRVVPGEQVHCSVQATDMDTKNCNPGTEVPGVLRYSWKTWKGASCILGCFSNAGQGSSVTWTAPQPLGTYTLIATVEDAGTTPVGDCGSRWDQPVAKSVEIVVDRAILQDPLQSDLSPFPPPPGGPPGGSGRSAIMTGAVLNAVHQATLTATVVPAVEGTVTFQILGNTGVNHRASLQVFGQPWSDIQAVAAPLNSAGHARAVLTSSDKDAETITVRATFEGQIKTITIPQATGDYPRPDGFVCDPASMPADGQSTSTIRFCLVQYGTTIPVPGHHVTFVIDSILDENGEPLRDSDGHLITGPNWPTEYGSITLPCTAVTAADGTATGTYKVGTAVGTILIREEDSDDQAIQP